MIELLTVVAVTGMLAVMAAPNLTGGRDRRAGVRYPRGSDARRARGRPRDARRRRDERHLQDPHGQR